MNDVARSDPSSVGTVSEQRRTRVGFIGAGAMARYHLEGMLDRTDTEVVAVCEPSPASLATTAELFTRRGLPVPPNEPDWTRFVATYADRLDAAFIITPHVFHYAQATACLEAGLDVLLEKPMVMTGAEATGLIETRDRTGRLLVVAFPGSLSPQVREASRLLRSGDPRRDPQYRRPRLAGLGGGHDGNVAPGPGDLGRRVPVRYGRPHAEYGDRPRRRGVRPGRGLARGRWTARRYPGRGHGPARVGRALHLQRLWPGDPVMRLGHPGLHDRGGAAHRDLGRAARAPTSRPGRAAQGALGRRHPGLGAVPQRPGGSRAQPESAGGRASGWPACGTRSASPRRGGAVITNPTAGRRSSDDIG